VKAESFFDKYAGEYDWLTNAEGRTEGHRREVDALIERFNPRRVLDAGCATGLTASLFASKGIEAVGLDRSRSMLEVAKGKYATAGLPLKFRSGSFESLPTNLSSGFDLVVCLANSIVGVGSKSNLIKSLKGFKRVLQPGGYLVLQALNVDALADRQLMPVRTTYHDGVFYSRFMERTGSRSLLYILRVDSRQMPPQAELFRHESAGISISALSNGLKRAGFTEVKSFADLTMKQRFSKESRDVVLVARRP
jgi:ubiquinone/menaquinone biosynthesis C-methylase UbiE